MNDLFIVKL